MAEEWEHGSKLLNYLINQDSYYSDWISQCKDLEYTEVILAN